jgi:hypothetical protein
MVLGHEEPLPGFMVQGEGPQGAKGRLRETDADDLEVAGAAIGFDL